MSAADAELAAWRAAWEAVARYTVVLHYPHGKPAARVLARGQTLSEAEAMRAPAEEAARIEAGLPATASSWIRPLVTIELENGQAAREACRNRLRGRQGLH